MSDEVFEFRVNGHQPRPWGTGDAEWTWRGRVADAIREAGAAAQRRLPIDASGFESPSLSIEILFRMSPARFLDADFDNLAKPVLDRLFRAKHVRAPTDAGGVSGVLFDFDDLRVVRLVLEKSRVESVGEAGIDVVVATVRAMEPPTRHWIDVDRRSA